MLYALIACLIAIAADHYTTKRGFDVGAVETNSRVRKLGLWPATAIKSACAGVLYWYGWTPLLWGCAGLLAVVAVWNRQKIRVQRAWNAYRARSGRA